MTALPDTTLAFWSEHREQLRQSESQRAILTNFVLVIAAGISGLVVQQKFAWRTIPLSALIILAGLYGALAAAKYHERADYHLTQARALARALVAAGDLPDHQAQLDQSRAEHYRKYPHLSKIRLHWLWTGFHLAIAAYGATLILITLLTT